MRFVSDCMRPVPGYADRLLGIVLGNLAMVLCSHCRRIPLVARRDGHTLEDAWADARVNRRWQHFIVQVSADETDTLLLRATSMWMPAPSSCRKLIQRATAGSPPKKSSQTMGASVA